MINFLKGPVPRKAALAGLLAFALSTSALAAGPGPSSGLGESWPNATDVSTSPHWHVYVFQRDGIRYIQVNDLNGKVRAALAASNGEFLVLPIGADAEHVSTSQQSAAANTTTDTQAASEQVYNDGSVQLSVKPHANGVMLLNATNGCAPNDPLGCGSHASIAN
jgi:hypothetical protein